MDQTEIRFRVKHTQIIELCVKFEYSLSSLYCLLRSDLSSEEKYELLDKRDLMPFGKLIKTFEDLDLKTFPDGFVEKLTKARDIRNYYVHAINYEVVVKHKKVDIKYLTKIDEDFCFLCFLYDELQEIYKEHSKRCNF